MLARAEDGGTAIQHEVHTEADLPDKRAPIQRRRPSICSRDRIAIAVG